MDIPVLLNNCSHGLILELKSTHNANLMIELIHELRVLAELIFCGFAALTQTIAIIGIPGT